MNLNEPKIEPRLLDDLKARGLLMPANALLPRGIRGRAAVPTVIIDEPTEAEVLSAVTNKPDNWLRDFDKPAARPGETIDDDGVITIKSAPGGEVGNRLQTDFARMFRGS